MVFVGRVLCSNPFFLRRGFPSFLWGAAAWPPPSCGSAASLPLLLLGVLVLSPSSLLGGAAFVPPPLGGATSSLSIRWCLAPSFFWWRCRSSPFGREEVLFPPPFGQHKPAQVYATRSHLSRVCPQRYHNKNDWHCLPTPHSSKIARETW